MPDEPRGQPVPEQPNTSRIRNKLLGDREARLEQELVALRAELDEVRDGFSRLSAQMRSAADGDADDDKPPFHLAELTPEQREEREQELKAWVTDVVKPWHPTVGKLLTEKPCWSTHQDVMQAVNAAALAYRGAHVAKSRKDADPSMWLRDHLATLEKQLRVALGGDALEPCKRCG